ncbi:hypothetical protein TNCV_2277701 [Trichonephila clavipes]|nr:hypothetical protein TNCV_2277701 [Trichonephila clavipes]
MRVSEIRCQILVPRSETHRCPIPASARFVSGGEVYDHPPLTGKVIRIFRIGLQIRVGSTRRSPSMPSELESVTRQR